MVQGQKLASLTTNQRLIVLRVGVIVVIANLIIAIRISAILIIVAIFRISIFVVCGSQTSLQNMHT